MDYPDNNTDDKKEMTQTTTVVDVSEKFWSNEIIWEIVTSYLNISDLKNVSCANKYFQQRVRSLSRFTSLSGQVVDDKMKIHVFKLTRAIVEVNKIDSNALQELSEKTFKDTEHLEIHCVNKLSDAELNSRLIQIVSNCPKLKSLVFTRLNFLGKNLDVFFKNTNVRQVLSNLKEVHLELEIEKITESQFAEYADWAYSLGLERMPDSLHTWKIFPDLQMKLKTFSYTEPLWTFRCWFSPAMVLGSSQSTLVKLELKLPPKLALLAELVKMKFPKLEKLNLDILIPGVYTPGSLIASPEDFAAMMIPFLENHLSTMKEFKLSSNVKLVLTPFQAVLQTSTKIEVLVFTIRDPTMVFTYTDWDFLKTRATLHSFGMTIPSCEKIRMNETSACNSFINYLNVLPSTIKSIQFGGVSVNGVGPQPLMSQIISSLMRFQNVTVLKLLFCLDDQILGFICKHLTQLLIFEAYFTFVSDRGICGVSDSEDQYDRISKNSLSNLKGLNKLVLKASPTYNPFRITWDGLISAIRFLGLVELRVEAPLSASNSSKEMYYRERQMFQDRKFLQLVSSHRNSSLEKVYIQSYIPGSDIIEELQTVNPRIKSDYFF